MCFSLYSANLTMFFTCSNEDNFMKRFKQHVMSLKDDVDEFEAVDSYKKYKTKYKKNSITKFYKAHQNEEWYVVIILSFFFSFFFFDQSVIKLWNSPTRNHNCNYP